MRKPLVTIALLAYNQRAYVRAAVESVLSQAYEPLEIILSDDSSTDDTYDVLQQAARDYAGPHRVVFNRNPENLGLCEHVNRIAALATGECLLLAGGDDVAQPNRVGDSVEIFLRHPEVTSVSLGIEYIDASGRNLRPRQAPRFREGQYTLRQYIAGERPPILGASRAYRRSLFRDFGPLSARCRAEDAALVFRGLLQGDVWHSERVGVKYRVHDKNLSAAIDSGAIRSLFRQHSVDLRSAEKRGAISVDLRDRTRQELREMLRRGLLIDVFRESRQKLCIFVACIALSPRYARATKKSFALEALRQLLPGSGRRRT